MIKLKSIINEVVDGRGYFTKEKFGSIILSQLQREDSSPPNIPQMQTV